MKTFILAALLVAADGCLCTQPTPSAVPPVPPEIVFDICSEYRVQWDYTGDVDRALADKKRRFDGQSAMWGLSEEEKSFLKSQCQDLNQKLRDRLGEIRLDPKTGTSLGRDDNQRAR